VAIVKFPRECLIPYNLACYCAQLGDLEEAKSWFVKAMEIEEMVVKRMVVDDPDLKPLWDSMKGDDLETRVSSVVFREFHS
jgi:hypothetical protein